MKLQEINFRVWLKSDKRYIALNSEIDFPHEYGIMKTNKGKMFAIYKCNGEFDKFSDIEVEFWTGLIDEKGAKIYEGDILEITNYRFKDTIEAVVVWQKGGLLMKVIKTYDEDEVCIGKEIPFSEVHSYLQKIDLVDLVVTGNIHENPELLEGE